MNIAEILTDRLILRSFQEADIDHMQQILNGKDVLRYFPKTDPLSRERVERMINHLLEHWEEHEFGLWAVESISTGELMGRSGLQVIPETGEIEVDFILGRNFWGQGYATEAGLASLKFGFEDMQMDNIVGIVHVENAASQRVLEKIGMRCTRRAQYFGIECYRYAISRIDYSV